MKNTEDQELSITHVLKAPINLVWDSWTQPSHLINWWGPAGFTCTIDNMDVKTDGEWNLTLHGQDGTNYPNRSIYREIIPLKKIVFEHFHPHFITIVLFEPQGTNTHIQWTLRFDTADMRNTIVKAHKADKGQKENLEKLEHYLASLSGQNKINQTAHTPFAQTYFHGTKASLKIGDYIRVGINSNYGQRNNANYIYLTATLDAAIWGAELALGEEPERIYLVEATGALEDDPNLTDKKFPGNPTKSYRSKQPFKVVGEITIWEGHPAEQIHAMKAALAKLKEEGIEAIE